MAVTADITKVAVSLLLNNGVDSDGNVVTVTSSMPAIDREVYVTNLAASRQKIFNVISAMETVLSKEVYNVREVQTSYLSAE